MYDWEFRWSGAGGVTHGSPRGNQPRIAHRRDLQQLLIVVLGLLSGPRGSGEHDQIVASIDVLRIESEHAQKTLTSGIVMVTLALRKSRIK